MSMVIGLILQSQNTENFTTAIRNGEGYQHGVRSQMRNDLSSNNMLRGGNSVKKITLELPDGYNQLISVTIIGTETRGCHTITNVMTKGFEVEDNCTYRFLVTDGASGVVKEKNNE